MDTNWRERFGWHESYLTTWIQFEVLTNFHPFFLKSQCVLTKSKFWLHPSWNWKEKHLFSSHPPPPPFQKISQWILFEEKKKVNVIFKSWFILPFQAEVSLAASISPFKSKMIKKSDLWNKDGSSIFMSNLSSLASKVTITFHWKKKVWWKFQRVKKIDLWDGRKKSKTQFFHIQIKQVKRTKR